MLLTIFAIWFGYKKARDSGRNGILWGAICGGVFIGTQFMVAIGAGIFIGIGVEMWGWKETLYDDMSWVITLASIVASIVALLIVFKFLDRIPDDDPPVTPPPPPTFENNDQP